MGVLFHLAWRNLWRNPRRTWLSASAIVFAAALLIFMITLQLGSYDAMIDSSLRVYHGHAQIQRPGYQDKPQIRNAIPNAVALAERIRASTPLSGIAVRANAFALASSESRSYGVQVVGVQPRHEANVSSIPGLVKSGRYLSSADAQEVVVGSALARNLKLAIGDELTLLGSGRDGSVAATILPVVGIFDSGSRDLDRSFVEVPLATFQDVFAMRDGAHAIVVVGDSLSRQGELVSRLRAEVAKDKGLTVLSWEELMPGLKQAIEVDMLSGWFMYIMLIVVVTFSILNTFLMSVLERTREFGLMLALGLKPFHIGRLVLLESFLLTAIGLTIGLVVGVAIVTYFHFNGFSYPGMEEFAAQFNIPGKIHPQISFVSVALGPAVILVATTLASLIPLLRIRRLQAVEAMRAV